MRRVSRLLPLPFFTGIATALLGGDCLLPLLLFALTSFALFALQSFALLSFAFIVGFWILSASAILCRL